MRSRRVGVGVPDEATARGSLDGGTVGNSSFSSCVSLWVEACDWP